MRASILGRFSPVRRSTHQHSPSCYRSATLRQVKEALATTPIGQRACPAIRYQRPLTHPAPGWLEPDEPAFARRDTDRSFAIISVCEPAPARWLQLPLSHRTNLQSGDRCARGCGPGITARLGSHRTAELGAASRSTSELATGDTFPSRSASCASTGSGSSEGRDHGYRAPTVTTGFSRAPSAAARTVTTSPSRRVRSPGGTRLVPVSRATPCGKDWAANSHCSSSPGVRCMVASDIPSS